MSTPVYCAIELNYFARGICVDRWSGTMTAETALAELIDVSRQCLMIYWKEDDDRVFVPQPANEEALVPDEVVVRAPDGRALYRRTIIEEKIARWFAE